MRKLLIANWKANPDTAIRALALARKIHAGIPLPSGVDVVIAPPFPFLQIVGGALRRAKLGAQDLFWEDLGPYTGEVSWRQLKSLGVEYAIIGHSERRALVGETDEMINKKVRAALEAGITPVLCVGEPKEVRKSGIAAVKRYVAAQIEKDLANTRMGEIVIAYEPIWAIGTGTPDSPRSAAEMIHYIKERVPQGMRKQLRVLYGGSCTAANADIFLKEPEIDGALVGGASLNPREFIKIINIAKRYG
ncbi:MAG: triose-phosphate isomerase [Candidatus Yanofskybacteria bacterium]|nr:triose-phosphate isomerase [Candidatus Yanofskybacteria bacterium]